MISIMWILISIATLIGALVVVAFFTLAERKMIASIQRRRGPNVVGFFGLLQPIADGVKLLGKEIILPSKSNKELFIFAPFLTFVISLINWGFMPLGYLSNVISDTNFSIFLFFASSSIGIYGIILSGWASNSRYAFLGAIRSTAQMVSYEVSMGILVLPVAMCSGSLDLSMIIQRQSELQVWFALPLFPIFILFLVTCLAETNRTPFYLPEAEAELVAGFNVEYSSLMFAFFFLGEYGNMFIFALFIVDIFLGGWSSHLSHSLSLLFYMLKILGINALFVILRASLPRYRYDQLMLIGWETILPVTLGYILFIAGSLLYFSGEPVSYVLPFIKN